MINFENIPASLKQEKRWVMWAKEQDKNGRPTKVLYQLNQHEKYGASHSDPATWGEFADAKAVFNNTSVYDGVGFVLGSGRFGIDLDGHIDDNGVLSHHAERLLAEFETYAEISPSGRGLHIIGYGKKPGPRARCAFGGGEIEIYDDKRYFTMTGDRVGNHAEIADCQAQLTDLYHELFPAGQESQRAGGQEGRRAGGEETPDTDDIDDIDLLSKAMSNPKNGRKFARLWHGDISEYRHKGGQLDGQPDHSAADLALCSYLAFWTGGDWERIDALFRRSGLYREKWDREDYRRWTLEKACEGSATYNPNYRSGNPSDTSASDPNHANEEQSDNSMESVWDELSQIEADTDDAKQIAIKERLWDLSATCSAWSTTDFGRFCDRLTHTFKIPKVWIANWTKTFRQGDSGSDAEKSAVQLADDFIAQHYTDEQSRLTLAYQNDSWYGYEGNRYTEISKAEFHTLLAKHIREDGSNDVSVNLVNSMKLAVAPVVMIPDKVFMPCWRSTLETAENVISLENGILDLSKEIAGESNPLQSHTPDCIILSSQPYRYNPSAQCPRWLQFLHESLPDPDLQAILQEFFGLCLTHDQRFHCFLFIHGESRTGKGVTLETLQALVGADNVSNLALRDFGSQFGFESTIGKKVNINAEVPELEKVDEDILKEYTGGSNIFTINRKHKPAIHTTQRVKIAMSSNHQPNFRDRSQGLWNRILFVTFSNVAKEIDPNLPTYIAENELAGVFNWAVAGYQRLCAQGRFTESWRMREAVGEYQEESIPAQEFFNTYLTFDMTYDGATHAKTMYRYYRQWARCEGKQPQGMRTFGKDIATHIRNAYQVDGIKDRYGRAYPRVHFADEMKEMIIERAINEAVLRFGTDGAWKYGDEDGKYDYGPGCNRSFADLVESITQG